MSVQVKWADPHEDDTEEANDNEPVNEIKIRELGEVKRGIFAKTVVVSRNATPEELNHIDIRVQYDNHWGDISFTLSPDAASNLCGALDEILTAAGH